MIIAAGESDGKPLLVLILTKENLRLLGEGNPIAKSSPGETPMPFVLAAFNSLEEGVHYMHREGWIPEHMRDSALRALEEAPYVTQTDHEKPPSQRNGGAS